MIIQVKGQRSFQVLREGIKGECREAIGSHPKKLAYLDPGFDYDVDDAFGADMIRRYPHDIAEMGHARTFHAAEKPAEKKVEAPKVVVAKPVPVVVAPIVAPVVEIPVVAPQVDKKARRKKG